MEPRSRGVRENDLALATGDLEDGARLVLNPLAFAARDRLNPAVGARGHSPQEADVGTSDLTVEARSHHDEVDVAPRVGLAARMRTEDDRLANLEGVITAEDVQIAADGGHNCWINQSNTSRAFCSSVFASPSVGIGAVVPG